MSQVLLCRPQLERREALGTQVLAALLPFGISPLPVPCLRLCVTCEKNPVARVDGTPLQAVDDEALCQAIIEAVGA